MLSASQTSSNNIAQNLLKNERNSGWLTLGGEASLRRALSHGGQQASWQPEGLVKSIAALEVRADGDEHALRLCALGSLPERLPWS